MFCRNDERLSKVEKFSEGALQKMQSLTEKEDNLTDMTEKFTELQNSVLTFQDKIEHSASTIENIEEKLYDFEMTKKNNLIFYGIPAPRNETRHSLSKAIEVILVIEGVPIIMTFEDITQENYIKEQTSDASEHE